METFGTVNRVPLCFQSTEFHCIKMATNSSSPLEAILGTLQHIRQSWGQSGQEGPKLGREGKGEACRRWCIQCGNSVHQTLSPLFAASLRLYFLGLAPATELAQVQGDPCWSGRPMER